jgi:hypothetical protein
MSNMDVGKSLRWLSASTLTKSHHFDSTSESKSSTPLKNKFGISIQ